VTSPATRIVIARRSVTILAGAALVATLAACSAGTASPTPEPTAVTIPHPTGASDLILRYEEVGGFVGPGVLLGRYPIISVYDDGTVITQGAVPAIFPGPALPSLIATKLSEAGIQRLLAAAAGAGLLGPDAQYDATGVADATTAQFTVVAGGGHHVVSAYALGIAGPGNEGPFAAARARLQAFTVTLGDLRTRFAADVVGADIPFAYTSLKALVRDGAPQSGDPAISRVPLAWPLATSLATFGSPGTGAAAGWRCGVVTGADLAALKPLLAQATSITGWSSGGAVYTLMPLPILPDDAGC
jgi:hypothetical protein